MRWSRGSSGSASPSPEPTATFQGARTRLLVYDLGLTDNMMQRVLERAALAGAEVRVIGKLEKRLPGVRVAAYEGERLHVRAIVVDDRQAFVGSQSLRRPELDRRREIGVIVSDRRVVRLIAEVFEADWKDTGKPIRKRRETKPLRR